MLYIRYKNSSTLAYKKRLVAHIKGKLIVYVKMWFFDAIHKVLMLLGFKTYTYSILDIQDQLNNYN